MPSLQVQRAWKDSETFNRPVVSADKSVQALLNLQQHWCFYPEILKAIELALIAGEQVNNHVAVIDQNPSTLNFAFHAARSNTPLPHSADDLALKRSQLPDIVSGRNNEYIGKGRQFADVEQSGIGGEHLRGDPGDITSEFDGFDNWPPPKCTYTSYRSYSGPGRDRTCDLEVMSPLLYH